MTLPLNQQRLQLWTYLACHSPFQQYRSVLIDKAEPLEHLHSTLIVGQELEVLIRQSQFELLQAAFDNLALVQRSVLAVSKCLRSDAST